MVVVCVVGRKLYVVPRLTWDDMKVRENGCPTDKWVPRVEAAKYGDFEFVHSWRRLPYPYRARFICVILTLSR